ncbi:histidine phosphatase family protein [Virgisporangium ochraceum]|uniref:Phosphatase n=1 Tax=Virgisporangium ochraceum TaxID=65505 RepID=A0A8J4A240_9ACTN|nr:histidine phosphatase family protein [Virgisporangium ochraceum]GIJ73398.1 phosphatase [Virgisporangium ochraceum]
MGEIVLIRHGETEWSAARRHTSVTDLDLTDAGVRQAQAVAATVRGRTFAAVVSSPRRRALRTADLAGLAPTEVTEDLAEWNYGRYEGVTTADVHAHHDPGWDLWTDGCPGGESPTEVGARIDRLLDRVAPLLDTGDVALVAHGHSLRVTGARWIGLPPAGGGLLKLDTATVSVLGFEHGRRVIHRWNAATG